MAYKNITFLVVDDQENARRTLVEILKDEGYKVIEAEDGYQAIEAVRSESIDLVLMDIVMPGINGVQAFREIRQIVPNMAVVMLTGFAGDVLAESAIEEGAMSVITKPFEVENLADLLHLARIHRSKIAA